MQPFGFTKIYETFWLLKAILEKNIYGNEKCSTRPANAVYAIMRVDTVMVKKQ
jgi:hypothetical protein